MDDAHDGVPQHLGQQGRSHLGERGRDCEGSTCWMDQPNSAAESYDYGLTNPHFQLPTQLDGMEAQMRADLLSKKVLLETILTLAYQKKATTVSQILVLVFQQYVPAESAVRLNGMSAMEQPLRPARTFEDASTRVRTECTS